MYELCSEVGDPLNIVLDKGEKLRTTYLGLSHECVFVSGKKLNFCC